MKTKVMKYAVNYDLVVNYIYDSDDFITDKIINYYKNYVLEIIPKEKYQIKKIDMIVKEYLNNIYFNSYVKESIDYDTDYYYDLDYVLEGLYKKFIIKEGNKIGTHKWL